MQQIFKRYGSALQSVDVDFDARAMNEIGFRRNRKASISVDDFESDWSRIEERAFTATAEGPVQYEAEVQVLQNLEAELSAFLDHIQPGDILVIESRQGVDYPKLREKRDDVLVGGDNQFYFHWSVDPPLRVAQYRKSAG